MKSYNYVEPETSRMKRATAVWHPKIPNVDSYSRVAPKHEELQPCRTRNIPNEKSYSRVAAKRPECEQLQPYSTRNIQNVNSYNHAERATSRM